MSKTIKIDDLDYNRIKAVPGRTFADKVKRLRVDIGDEIAEIKNRLEKIERFIEKAQGY
jgi:hypothetical protein